MYLIYSLLIATNANVVHTSINLALIVLTLMCDLIFDKAMGCLITS